MSVVIETTAGDITVDLYTKVSSLSYSKSDNPMIMILILISNFQVQQ